MQDIILLECKQLCPGLDASITHVPCTPFQYFHQHNAATFLSPEVDGAHHTPETKCIRIPTHTEYNILNNTANQQSAC